MTEPTEAPDIVDDGVSDVLTDADAVHVSPAVVALAEEPQHAGETFITDVPNWDEPDSE